MPNDEHFYMNTSCTDFCLLLSRESPTHSLPHPHQPKTDPPALFTLGSKCISPLSSPSPPHWPLTAPASSKTISSTAPLLWSMSSTTTPRNCAGDEPTVKIGVGSKAQDRCIPFSQGYTTVSYSYLESGNSSRLGRHAGFCTLASKRNERPTDNTFPSPFIPFL